MTTATAIPMHDEVLAATGLNGLGMKFRCRIFENPPITIALLTDLDDANPGPSITNSIEHAVGAVLRRWPEIDAARLVIVEHYDDRPTRARVAQKFRRCVDIGRENGESFDLVTFDAEMKALRDQSARLCRSPREPHWKHTTKANVEDLIGGRLP
jgi:hypothetical protein